MITSPASPLAHVSPATAMALTLLAMEITDWAPVVDNNDTVAQRARYIREA
jgi:hypothetical protein